MDPTALKLSCSLDTPEIFSFTITLTDTSRLNLERSLILCYSSVLSNMDASSQEYIDEIKVVGAHDVSLSICRTKPRGVRVAKKVNQRKSKLMGCTCRLKYYNRTRLVCSHDSCASKLILYDSSTGARIK